jgi:hypothetical protein
MLFCHSRMSPSSFQNPQVGILKSGTDHVGCQEQEFLYLEGRKSGIRLDPKLCDEYFGPRLFFGPMQSLGISGVSQHDLSCRCHCSFGTPSRYPCF